MVSEEEARAILARHGIPWDGPIEPPRPNPYHNPPGRAMDFNVPAVYVPVVRFDGQPLTVEQLEVLRRLYAPGQLEQLGDWFARLSEALGTAFKNIQDTMRSMGLVADPGEEYDDDPRRRALALRRNRNTGPARPSAAQARRPRRHQ